MKKMIFLALLFSTAVSAQDVYVMTKTAPSETVHPDQYIYVLFKDKPCALQISDAKYMHKAAIFNTSSPDIGCWGKTLSQSGADILIIGPYGNKSTAALTEFYSANLDKDGTGHVSGRAISYGDYFNNIKKSQHRQD
ncbi:hypothetical protein [Burkholderia gladioli]|uniref:hypothetical protein n=1 Tax=Burkholderia gladioli TaxID=28095 RepID=UPI00163F760B|nr:hypothetical protein [Burkholderia gladioli]